MADCNLCQSRTKTWTGSDPKCSFPDGGRFTPEGWNCATANALRDICEASEVYCDDQKYAALNVSELEIGALTLWVSWYKRRGRTEAMWLLSETDAPIQPTESQALAVITALKE